MRTNENQMSNGNINTLNSNYINTNNSHSNMATNNSGNYMATNISNIATNPNYVNTNNTNPNYVYTNNNNPNYVNTNNTNNNYQNNNTNNTNNNYQNVNTYNSSNNIKIEKNMDSIVFYSPNNKQYSPHKQMRSANYLKTIPIYTRTNNDTQGNKETLNTENEYNTDINKNYVVNSFKKKEEKKRKNTSDNLRFSFGEDSKTQTQQTLQNNSTNNGNGVFLPHLQNYYLNVLTTNDTRRKKN